MKNVRIFYKKKDRMRFVSHLDMNRFMSRIIKKSSIPVWYTEGFNPHPYITFALPLSLGFESEYEIMDIRLNDDMYSFDDVKQKLNDGSPSYIEIFDVREPVLKVGKVAFAEFIVSFDTANQDFYNALEEFLKKDSIVCKKATKKGNIKEIDIAPKIIKYNIFKDSGVNLSVVLPAGSEDNINPALLIEAFENMMCQKSNYSIVRTKIFDSEMKDFV